MNAREIITRSGLPLPFLASLAGLSLDTLASMKVGRRAGSPESLARLARALREHGQTLQGMADVLDPPPAGEPDPARGDTTTDTPGSVAPDAAPT